MIIWPEDERNEDLMDVEEKLSKYPRTTFRYGITISRTLLEMLGDDYVEYLEDPQSPSRVSHLRASIERVLDDAVLDDDARRAEELDELS